MISPSLRCYGLVSPTSWMHTDISVSHLGASLQDYLKLDRIVLNHTALLLPKMVEYIPIHITIWGTFIMHSSTLIKKLWL